MVANVRIGSAHVTVSANTAAYQRGMANLVQQNQRAVRSFNAYGRELCRNAVFIEQFNPTRLNKQVNPSAQEKFDHAQEVANKLNAIKLDRELPQKDSYEDMMKKLGIQHKDKQEQSITRAGKIKV